MPRSKKRPRLKSGRPKFVMPWNRFDELVRAHGTLEGIADILDTDSETIHRRLMDEKGTSFSTYAKNKRQAGVNNIFMAQYQYAMKGNTELLKLLGKEWGGQGKEVADTAPSEAVLKPFLEKLMEFQGKITTTFEPRPRAIEHADTDTHLSQ